MKTSQLFRLVAILTIAFGIAACRLPLILLAALAGPQHFYAAIGNTLAICIEALGPVFVKIGQMLSYRVDLLPESMLQPLMRLQDRANPLSPRRTRAAAEAGLGHSLSDVFATFSDTPVACGSIAVVCKAATRDGQTVAVKVVRPGIADRIERDLACLRWIAGTVGRSRHGRGLPIVETFEMIALIVSAQADMLAESRNLTVFRAMLPAHRRIVIPEPLAAFTTRDVLVMDFVEDAVQLMQAAIPDKAFRRATRDLLDLLYSMIFVRGVVHCDMHPGNVLWRADGAVALIDAGLITSLADADRCCFRDFFLSLACNDPADCAGAILRSALHVPDCLDRAAFQRDVDALVHTYHGRAAGSFLIAEFVFRVFELQRRYGLFGAPGFVSAIWALVMFEGLVRTRYPDLDFQSAAQPFLVADLINRLRREAASTQPGPAAGGEVKYRRLGHHDRTDGGWEASTDQGVDYSQNLDPTRSARQ
jgi:ubiquinone biosynthesis protein